MTERLVEEGKECRMFGRMQIWGRRVSDEGRAAECFDEVVGLELP